MEGRVLLHKSAVFYCVRKSAVFYYVENRAYVSKIIPISRDNDLSISLKSTAQCLLKIPLLGLVVTSCLK